MLLPSAAMACAILMDIVLIIPIILVPVMPAIQIFIILEVN
jgi:hypothetical protein